MRSILTTGPKFRDHLYVLAEADCTQFQIMAIHGHTDSKSSEPYTRQAKRKKMAIQGLERADIGKMLGLKS